MTDDSNEPLKPAETNSTQAANSPSTSTKDSAAASQERAEKRTQLLVDNLNRNLALKRQKQD